MLGAAFGTAGTPINKTALLLELQARIDSLNATNLELKSKVDLLNASLLESQSNIDDLNASLTSQINVLITQMVTMNTTIGDLRTDIGVLNATKLGKPDYDSGWMSISAGTHIVLTHNLNTTNALVYMIGNETSPTRYVHQVQYGGDNDFGVSWGAYWSELTASSIRIDRQSDDSNWKYVRVFMWKIPQP